MSYLLLLFLLFALQFAYFRIADKFNIIDKPNERSSHTQVTLRGGGIVFWIAYLIYFVAEGFQYPWFTVGLTFISLISFADDIKPQSSKIRLIVHFLSMGLMFYQWGLFHMPWYFILIALIFCTGMLNAYNFMDGINGITGGYSLVVMVAFWYINTYLIPFVDTKLILYLIVALIVFNFFNFRKKATCFAGDVGSIAIAFINVFLMGLLVLKASDYSYIVLLAVYGVDSVLTIIHRLILKENIFDAHRKHAYQLMANELKIPHLLVTTIYAGIQLLLFVGFVLFKSCSYTYSLVVISILCLMYIGFKMKFFHLHSRT